MKGDDTEKVGFYTKEELLSFYSPYLRPPAGFPVYDKITLKAPMAPVAFATEPAEDEVDESNDLN
jgi:hypothetical protein